MLRASTWTARSYVGRQSASIWRTASAGGDAVRELEAEFAAGRITNHTFAESEAGFYAGRSLADVSQALERLPVLAGVQHATDALKARNVHILLTTLAWGYAARLIAKRFGFDACTGCAMVEADGVLTGAIACHISPDDKRTFAERYCADLGCSMRDVIAVGDSRSDIPLFRAVGHSIALNASEAARDAATCAIETEDFSDILQAIPGLMA